MAENKIYSDSKIVKVLAADARHERQDSKLLEEANNTIRELASDLNPMNKHLISEVAKFTIQELQKPALDFLNGIADHKTVAYGEKAAFNVKTGRVHAYMQAKGATTARSYVAGRQLLVDTNEISARPAINSVDLKTGRVNMADLLREANEEMTNMKIMKVEDVLFNAITGGTYSSPFYATGTGIVKSTLDTQLAYFRRFGKVTILGDFNAVAQLAPLTGMAMNAGTNTDAFNQYSNDIINEVNMNGLIGNYYGTSVIAMQNANQPGTTNPMLRTDMLYIVPAGMTGDARNLKLVDEGGIETMESTNIDDLVFEIRLATWLTKR